MNLSRIIILATHLSGVCLLLCTGSNAATLYWTQASGNWNAGGTVKRWAETSGGVLTTDWVNDSAAVIEYSNPTLGFGTNGQTVSVTTLTINDGLTLTGTGSTTYILNITTGGSGNLTLATTAPVTSTNGADVRLAGTEAWAGTLATSGDGDAAKNRIRVNAATAVGESTKLNLAGLRVEFNGNSGDTFTIGELQGTAGEVQMGTGSSATKTLIVKQTSDTVFAGSFTRSNSAGTAILRKQGSGALTLSGSNALEQVYVEDGRLIVNGSITGNVTVSAGASLDGTGTVGSVTLNGGATILYDLSATGGHLMADSLVKGTGDGVYTFDFGGTGEAGQTCTLSSAVGAGFNSSDFAYANLASGLSGSFAIEGGTLTFSAITAAVPELSTYGMIAAAGVLAAALYRKKRQAKAGPQKSIP
ncbi:MAG: hypothetical protein LBK99_00170 [Opitutaceae bacterium]|jgi:hypothetical protein|nr:hypothetical protein [Opitutaceae bacterium]